MKIYVCANFVINDYIIKNKLNIHRYTKIGKVTKEGWWEDSAGNSWSYQEGVRWGAEEGEIYIGEVIDYNGTLEEFKRDRKLAVQLITKFYRIVLRFTEEQYTLKRKYLMKKFYEYQKNVNQV